MMAYTPDKGKELEKSSFCSKVLTFAVQEKFTILDEQNKY